MMTDIFSKVKQKLIQDYSNLGRAGGGVGRNGWPGSQSIHKSMSNQWFL